MHRPARLGALARQRSTRSVRVREGFRPKTRTPWRGASPPSARVKAISEALAAAPHISARGAEPAMPITLAITPAPASRISG